MVSYIIVLINATLLIMLLSNKSQDLNLVFYDLDWWQSFVLFTSIIGKTQRNVYYQKPVMLEECFKSKQKRSKS
jgi:hypothetical protein